MNTSEEGEDPLYIAESFLSHLPAIGSFLRKHRDKEIRVEYLEEINEARESIILAICCINKLKIDNKCKEIELSQIELDEKYNHLLHLCQLFNALYGYHPYDEDITLDSEYTI